MRSLVVALALVTGCGGAAGSPTPPSHAVPDDEPAASAGPKVRVHLISDVTHVAPGQEFSLGARFDIEPSWHIYWTNPGDAGLPTKATFQGPPGFEIGPARYPGPSRFEAPGEIVSFGYEEVAMISVPVVAPDTARPGDRIAFRVAAQWLACREECIRGSTNTELSLEVAGPTTPSQPAHQPFWSAHWSALPVAFDEFEGASHEARATGSETVLIIKIPGSARVHYFASPAEQEALAGQAVIPGDAHTEIHLSYRRPQAATSPPAIAGVLRVEDNDRVRFFKLELPWPSPTAGAKP